MKTILAILVLICFGKATGRAVAGYPQQPSGTGKVFVITLDGFRWQELFSGADTVLLKTASTGTKQRFYHANSTIRRRLLLPFMWKEIAGRGQLFGNRHLGNMVDVANPYRLSYPGYNELFSGSPDLLIWNNDPQRNTNKTIFEYAQAQPSWAGAVASFASWGMFPHIFHQGRRSMFVNAGTAGRFSDTRRDQDTYTAARAFIIDRQPLLFHLGLGGTDEAGHDGDYETYLNEAHQADRIIEDLWMLLQTHPFYKDQTTLIITTDHGRGNAPTSWSRHGWGVSGSGQTWMAILGKGVLPLGEHKFNQQVYSSQVAGTVAYLLGIRGFGKKALPLTLFTGDL